MNYSHENQHLIREQKEKSVQNFRTFTVAQDVLSVLQTFVVCGDFCCLLKTFENSLDPDQDRQNVGPDLDPNCLALLRVFLKEFFEKVNFEKSQW